MPRGKQRTLQNIESFIRRTLPRKLQADLKQLRIVKEADLECAAYFRLRRFIGEDPRWRVLARKFVAVTGHYVDLLVFKKTVPAIALELKWGRRQIGRKDRKSLVDALNKLKVNKAYWISALSSDHPRAPIVKKEREKYVLHQILVTPGLAGEALENWKRERRAYRTEIQTGKGRRPK